MATEHKINAKDHSILGVTVYQTDRAVVQRKFTVEVKAGQNDIIIGRLPTVLESDSIRVEAETRTTSRSQALTVFDVVYVPPSYARTSAALTEHGPELEQLNDEKAELEARVAALNGKKAMLEGYSDSMKDGRLQGVTIETLESMMELFVTGQAKIYSEKAKLQKEINTIAEKIKEIHSTSSTEEEEKRSAGVTVVLLAEEDGAVELLLSYVVRHASWSSLYDVRADLGATSGNSKDASPSVKLQYRANITQTTGEDWKGVALTLSTASPLTGSEIPKIQPWRITAWKPRPIPQWRSSTAVGSAAPEVMRSAVYAAAPMPPPPTGAFAMAAVSRSASIPEEASVYDEGPRIQLQEGAISSTFGIEGLSTIPSDSSSHKVSIATFDLSADLEWMTVPRMLSSTFLQCRIKNTSSYHLIAGPSSVFLDGNFVSKSQVPDVSPQESFTCSLGVDPSVRVTYHPQSKNASTAGGGLMSNKTSVTTFKQRITVKNTRAASIARLVVQDRVPVSEDSRVTVVVHQPSEKAIGPVAGPGAAAPTGGGQRLGGGTLGKSADQVLVENISKTVLARWAQKDEEKGGSGGSRGDGVIEWIVTDLRDTVDLNLVYEITTPTDVRWTDA